MNVLKSRVIVAVFVSSLVGAPSGYLVAAAQHISPANDLSCEELGKTTVLEVVPGWKFECARIAVSSKVSESASTAEVGKYVGLTDVQNNVIYVDPELGVKSWGVLEHEIGHAWAEDNLSDSQKQKFSEMVGSKKFYDSEYAFSPTEVWARSWENCSGHYPVSYANTVVSCETLWSYGAPKQRLDKPVTKNFFKYSGKYEL